MPLYDLVCTKCGAQDERQIPLAEYSEIPGCDICGGPMQRRILAAPLSRIAGVTPQGGGPDRFTADMLGYTMKDLPDALKVNPTGRPE